MKKFIKVISVFMVSVLALTGCAARESKRNSVSRYIIENQEEILNISREAKLVLNDQEQCIDCYNGELIVRCKDYDDNFNITLGNEKYKVISQFLINNSCVRSVSLENEDVCFFCSNGMKIMVTDTTIDEMNNPVKISDEYEKTIDVENKTITWISDHRKDTSSRYKGMYYKVYMENVAGNIWMCDHFSKAPSSSIFLR